MVSPCPKCPLPLACRRFECQKLIPARMRSLAVGVAETTFDQLGIDQRLVR